MMQFARRTSLVVVLLLAACTSPPTWTFWKETELTARDGRVIDVTRKVSKGSSTARRARWCSLSTRSVSVERMT